MEVSSNSRAKKDSYPVKEASNAEGKSFSAVKYFVGQKIRATETYYIVRWYGYGPKTTRSNLPSTFSPTLGRHKGDKYEDVNIPVGLQGGKEEQIKKEDGPKRQWQRSYTLQDMAPIQPSGVPHTTTLVRSVSMRTRSWPRIQAQIKASPKMDN